MRSSFPLASIFVACFVAWTAAGCGVYDMGGASPPSKPSRSAEPHTVTLRVMGKGRVDIHYSDYSRCEPDCGVQDDTTRDEEGLRLPWTKTYQITVTEHTVYVLSIIANKPGEVLPCSIEIDGREVDSGEIQCRYITPLGGI